MRSTNRVDDRNHDHTQIERLKKSIDDVRQIPLQNEAAFIRFARARGLSLAGVVTGEPGMLHQRSWLREDGADTSSQILFHPFRIYPLASVLRACELKIAPSSLLDRETARNVIDSALSLLPSDEQIARLAELTNQIVDLAILLEPVFWPKITGRYRYSPGTEGERYNQIRDQYRENMAQLLQNLDPEEWRSHHERLRIDAARIDDNHYLYVLLRVSSWNQRERLKGPVSCALWFRHIAEVIRRGFESVHSSVWPEEDEAFGLWSQGGRTAAYGSERPMDDQLNAKPHLAWAFGLFTGSIVRWYVEGTTEHAAITAILKNPAKFGIEIVNLKGGLSSGRANTALTLQGMLREDKSLGRFSMISFDRDVDANVKAIRQQIRIGNIIGMVRANDPDFELANFSVSELVDVAARLDEAEGYSGAPVRNACWDNIRSMSDFETAYRAVSLRHPSSLKGKKWGDALGAYAAINANRTDTGDIRPFMSQIKAALRARFANYDYHRNHYTLDPNTFELVEQKQEAEG